MNAPKTACAHVSRIIGLDREGRRYERQDRVMARVASRAGQRREKIETLRLPGGIARADEPERVATRINRLSRCYPDVRRVSPTAIRAGEPAAVTAAGAIHLGQQASRARTGRNVHR